MDGLDRALSECAPVPSEELRSNQHGEVRLVSHAIEYLLSVPDRLRRGKDVPSRDLYSALWALHGLPADDEHVPLAQSVETLCAIIEAAAHCPTRHGAECIAAILSVLTELRDQAALRTERRPTPPAAD
jgi:hypothetical protein